MPKVLVATVKPFAPAAVEQIRQIIENAGYAFDLLEKYSDPSEFRKAVSDAEALIVRSDLVDDGLIDSAGNLKIVVRAGAGYDNIDLKAASDRGIVVMNTPGQNSNAVAELTIGLMIYIARNQFNGSPGSELKHKKLGIHAYGYVGKIVARIAQGFGMEIYAFDPFLEDSIFEMDEVIRVHNVEDLYRTCQYVSLHIPSNEETINSINYNLLSIMPKGAVLINTARKEVVDEEALARILKERPDFRYASDIAPDNAAELKAEHPANCYFTPKKMGAQTEEANTNAGVAAAEQIVAFFERGDTTFRVN